MADLGEISEKMRGRINTILCEALAQNAYRTPPGRYVSLCFDDFPRSAFLNAAPMIEARNWRATWYTAGGLMGQESEIFGSMYEAEDLTSLVRRGHEIGCHTFDHVNCAHLSVADVAAQYTKNAAFFEEHGLPKAQSFAFPFGAANVAAKSEMTGTGLALRGINAGTNRGRTDISMLKACGIQRNKGGILRALEELDRLAANPGWLIIFTHDVREDHSDWGVSPEDFELLLSAIEMTRADVLPVSAMSARIRDFNQQSEPVLA